MQHENLIPTLHELEIAADDFARNPVPFEFPAQLIQLWIRFAIHAGGRKEPPSKEVEAAVVSAPRWLLTRRARPKAVVPRRLASSTITVFRSPMAGR